MTVMPSRMRVAAVVSALILAAGLLTLAYMAKPAQAQAATNTDTGRFTATPRSFICTEEVDFKVTVHFVGHITIDPNGAWHVHLQHALEGKGVGLRSGDKYVIHDVGSSTFYLPKFGEDQRSFTATQTVRVIRQGSVTPADDLHATATHHFTVTPQGEFTVYFDTFEFGCK